MFRRSRLGPALLSLPQGLGVGSVATPEPEPVAH